MDYFKNIHLRSILSNTSSQFLIKFIASATTFAVTIAISYFLGINLYGSFIKITAFVAFFYLLVDFGINSIFIKDYYKDVEKFFINVLSLRIIIALILFFLISIITLFLPYNPSTGVGYSPLEKTGIILFSLTLFSQALILSFNNIYQKNLFYKLAILPNLLASLVVFLFLGFGIFYKNIFIILISYFFSSVVFSTYALVSLRKRLSVNLRTENLYSFSKDILFSSFPLLLMLFFNLVYFRADVIILSLFKPNFDVGTYGFSYKIFEFIIAFPIFFTNSVYPILIKNKNTPEVFSKLVKRYSLFLLFFSLLFALFTFTFSPLLGIIKQEFISSILPLRILSFSLPFFFLTGLLQWVMIIRNQKKILVIIYFISMILNIVLNIIFIPKYSYIASSYITLISEGVVFILIILSMYILKNKKLLESYHE